MATAVALRKLRDGSSRGPDGSPRPGGAPQAAEREPGGAICCRFCLQEITQAAERSAQSGAHRHTFANPHGRVFEVGCFRNAPGCRVQGPALTEFSWFSGYAWRIALCGRCLNHLGWRFQGAHSGTLSPGFFGLILNHLIEIESDSSP